VVGLTVVHTLWKNPAGLVRASLPSGVMAHLDLDTTDLLAAAHRARDAAGLLAGATPGHLDLGTVSFATGDAGLAHAVEAVLTAWEPAHRALLATMERLGDGLAAAGESFETAEQVTAARLAGAISAAASAR
jgi:hypothetical protein